MQQFYPYKGIEMENIEMVTRFDKTTNYTDFTNLLKLKTPSTSN